MQLIKLIKDILSPKKCHSCNIEGYFLCKICYTKLEQFSSFCYVCKNKSKKYEVHNNCKQLIYYDNLVILTHYKNKIIKKLIHNLKFYGKKDISEDFGFFLSQKLLKQNFGLINKNNFLLTNIPITFTRKLKRGYNQSDLLAKQVSKITNINYKKNILIKIKNTKQQALLSKNERLTNLEKTFKINKKYIDKINNKTIILIDDVVSTGTTINTLSKILKQNGVKKIIGLVICSD